MIYVDLDWTKFVRELIAPAKYYITYFTYNEYLPVGVVGLIKTEWTHV